MKIECRKVGRSLVCVLEGELDLGTAAEFKAAVERYFDTYETIRNLVLVMPNVSFVDSSGLGAILGRYKHVRQLGGQLLLVGIKPSIRRIFDLSGLFKIMQEVESEELALAAL